MLKNKGLIVLFVMIILIILTGNNQAEMPNCSGLLRDNVKMYLNPQWPTHMPLWYELGAAYEWVVEVRGHATAGASEYYLVDNQKYQFWTTLDSFEKMEPCDEYEVTTLGPIKGIGCANPYDPQIGHRAQLMLQDGRRLGDNGATLGGWGYATLQNGEWKQTPALPNNPGGGLVEVYLTSFSEECLAALPIPEQE